MPYDLMMKSPVEQPENLNAYTAAVTERMRTAHALVQEQTAMAFGRAIRQYNERVKSLRFKPDDKVLYSLLTKERTLQKWL